MEIRESKLVLVVLDLAGYARATARLDALRVAALLDDWYRRCVTEVTRHGGRIVKFIGDGCLATFPATACLDALRAIDALRGGSDQWTEAHGAELDVGASVHLAVVAEGELGPPEHRRYDVVGTGVNHVFMMGGGPDVRISEPVYRQLPNEIRSAWTRRRPPATYTRSSR